MYVLAGGITLSSRRAVVLVLPSLVKAASGTWLFCVSDEHSHVPLNTRASTTVVRHTRVLWCVQAVCRIAPKDKEIQVWASLLFSDTDFLHGLKT